MPYFFAYLIAFLLQIIGIYGQLPIVHCQAIGC